MSIGGGGGSGQTLTLESVRGVANLTKGQGTEKRKQGEQFAADVGHPARSVAQGGEGCVSNQHRANLIGAVALCEPTPG